MGSRKAAIRPIAPRAGKGSSLQSTGVHPGTRNPGPSILPRPLEASGLSPGSVGATCTFLEVRGQQFYLAGPVWPTWVLVWPTSRDSRPGVCQGSPSLARCDVEPRGNPGFPASPQGPCLAVRAAMPLPCLALEAQGAAGRILGPEPFWAAYCQIISYQIHYYLIRLFSFSVLDAQCHTGVRLPCHHTLPQDH